MYSIARAGKLAAAALLASAGLLMTSVAIGHADTIQTEGTYPNRSACMDAGPGVKATTPGNWKNFWCVPDRLNATQWRLVLSTN
jgi:hypothetical protein